ncbi:hypothetical protein F543_23040 [Bibersteinia trehalosi USDA-ARS-USMARC-189]|uniref:Uncharacterized protein n=1 Tax=Bibersteinia trehalosi USDA-ARS-USMARC-189 TaxID=1263831 RepID=A0ABM5PHF8_BIBTR|nr:hypothetical protein [Bibersteinia trehalosi]AGH37368.1 hypothetical protein WQG_820 [Bibersteinia trehalosi USDA-ARS-USMARC-192]AHG85159.1 hypothetical protein F543_23040 [Bibersteinia trehalosi USDA-ARS-USMARC-189]
MISTGAENVTTTSGLIQGEATALTAPNTAEPVQFATDETASYFAGGMFSGNQF